MFVISWYSSSKELILPSSEITPNKRSQMCCGQESKISCVGALWWQPQRTAHPLHFVQGEGQGRVTEYKWLLYQSTVEPPGTVPHPLLYGEDCLCCSLRLQQVREGVLCGAEHPKRASMGTDTPKDCVIVKCNLTLLKWYSYSNPIRNHKEGKCKTKYLSRGSMG